ncbi:hypothetical protein AURDEDRAFT_71415, partial [Auricularia subglabra TFB-10046 SS5]
KRGHYTRFKWLLYCTWFMFLVSSAYWVASVARVVVDIRAFSISPSLLLQNKFNVFLSLRGSVILINVGKIPYICSQSLITMFLSMSSPTDTLTVPAASSAATIVIRVTLIVLCANNNFIQLHGKLDRAIKYTHSSSLICTLTTNIAATSLIALKAWSHRQLIKDHLKSAASGGRSAGSLAVLALVVESGALYCLSNVFILVSSSIHLPYGTLAQIHGPINSLLAVRPALHYQKSPFAHALR